MSYELKNSEYSRFLLELWNGFVLNPEPWTP
jgi:hypothetical protein